MGTSKSCRAEIDRAASLPAELRSRHERNERSRKRSIESMKPSRPTSRRRTRCRKPVRAPIRRRPCPNSTCASRGWRPSSNPLPCTRRPHYKGSEKLQDKVALITGGDSGIGRAVAVLFAREGADVAIAYLNEHEDAEETKRLSRRRDGRCILHLRRRRRSAVLPRGGRARPSKTLGKLDILVNNAAFQEHVTRHRRPDRRAFRPHAQDQPLRLFPHGEGGRSAHEAGQLRSSMTGSVTGLAGQQAPARLFDDQGRHPRLHPVAGARISSSAASASTPSRRGRSGRRSTPPTSRPRRWRNSAPTRR